MNGTASGEWKGLVLAVLEGVPADVPVEVAKRCIGNKGPLHRWIQLGLSADLSEVDMDAIEKILRQVPSLLEPVTAVTVPTLSAFDVAAHFRVTPRNEWQNAEVLIDWIGDNVQKLVKGKTEPEVVETTLRIHKLRKASVDGLIISELGEDVATTTWSQMYEMMRRQGHGQPGDLMVDRRANIFYIGGTDWVVGCRWRSDGDGWRVDAYPVAYWRGWGAGDRVVSR